MDPRRRSDLDRIARALDAAAEALEPYTPGAVAFEAKSERGDPVTEADLAVDGVLRRMLPVEGEGWLSEETADDPARLARKRVWVVDPLDGTREFVEGIPEWCISIGLLEDGVPVAGGVANPATGERVIGAVGHGIVEGSAAGRPRASGLTGARVLASRSEVRRGEWDRAEYRDVDVVPCGSVAYKLACVAAGLADATWTLVPKHEWDVAAGVALVRAAGLDVWLRDGSSPTFNRPRPLLPNLLAGSEDLVAALRARIGEEPEGVD